MARIIFLGIGGWISNPLLGYTSFAVVSSASSWLLVEAGEGVYRLLRLCGLDINENLSAVVISHRHGDHVLGLPTIMQMAKHKGLKALRVVAIADAIEAVKQIAIASGAQNALDIVNFIEARVGEKMKIDDFELEFIEAVHPVPAASIKILVDGKCIVYSGDTAFNPALINFAKGCDVLIHEASGHYKEAYRYGHSNYNEALEIALRSSVKKLVLIHFYQWPSPLKTPIWKEMEVYIPYPCQQLDL